MLAQERAGTRALAGMSAAYAAQGEPGRARELLSQALQWLSESHVPVVSKRNAHRQLLPPVVIGLAGTRLPRRDSDRFA
jgi:hypothetical protein